MCIVNWGIPPAAERDEWPAEVDTWLMPVHLAIMQAQKEAASG